MRAGGEREGESGRGGERGGVRGRERERLNMYTLLVSRPDYSGCSSFSKALNEMCIFFPLQHDLLPRSSLHLPKFWNGVKTEVDIFATYTCSIARLPSPLTTGNTFF